MLSLTLFLTAVPNSWGPSQSLSSISVLHFLCHSGRYFCNFSLTDLLRHAPGPLLPMPSKASSPASVPIRDLAGNLTRSQPSCILRRYLTARHRDSPFIFVFCSFAAGEPCTHQINTTVLFFRLLIVCTPRVIPAIHFSEPLVLLYCLQTTHCFC